MRGSGWFLLLLAAAGCHSGSSEGASAAPAEVPRPGQSREPAPTRAAEAQAPAAGSLSRLASIALPEGAPGIGFDDLRYSPSLDRVLVPAGRSGRLVLLDPVSHAVVDVTGFSEQPTYGGGHDDGVTSADAVDGTVFATDRTTQRLAVIDAASRRIVRSVALAAHPDYVRWVAPAREVWVTEPDAEALEVFGAADPSSPVHAASISVEGGPESLVIDEHRGRAYTHLWRGATVAVDLRSREIVGRWPNGCRSSRGIALEPEHGYVIAACAEGKITVMGPDDGHILSELAAGGRGVDVIDYDPRARHVYVPSASTGTMVVAALSSEGVLSELGRISTVRGAHCVATDRRGGAYVCDPRHGGLVIVRDGLSR